MTSARRWDLAALALVSVLLLPEIAIAAAGTAPPLQASHDRASGRDLYELACANCHGSDGRGAALETVAFPEPLPDFTDCAFATREPDADWLAVIHDGGPARAFAQMMAAFGGALPREQLEDVLAYVRAFCTDRNWPRGELNLPRPLVTEKAFPEDEAVFSMSAAAEGPGAVSAKLIYEKRFGARNQVEFILPVASENRGGGAWAGGVGDVGVAVKRALYHSLERGTIFSAAGEVLFPTGSERRGFGKGTAVFEPFLSFGQILGGAGFVQAQAGLELPADTEKAGREAFWRIGVGGSVSQGEWGRTWSPMLEVLAARELESGAATHWDLVPQVQVTLSTRQHIMANVGVRVPVNDASSRATQVLFYVLWDWFDGPLFGGW